MIATLIISVCVVILVNLDLLIVVPVWSFFLKSSDGGLCLQPDVNSQTGDTWQSCTYDFAFNFYFIFKYPEIVTPSNNCLGVNIASNVVEGVCPAQRNKPSYGL